MKKLVKKKTAVKGMTLIECIIALLVFGVMALLMVQICTTTANLLINTNHTNHKTAKEAPVAAVRDTNANGLTTVTPVTIKVSSNGQEYTINANKYNTGELDGLDEFQYDSNMKGNIQFYDVQRTTNPPAGP